MSGLLISLLLTIGFIVWLRCQIKWLCDYFAQALINKEPYSMDLLTPWQKRFLPNQVQTLMHAYNQFIAYHQQTKRKSSLRKRQIQVTLNHLQEAVFLINRNRDIVTTNPKGLGLCKMQTPLVGKRLEDFFEESRLIALVETAFVKAESQTEELLLKVLDKDSWFKVSVAPIKQKNVAEDWVLVILHDINELKHLERVRKDFIANVSHELRTPVTIIKGFADTLVEDISTLNKDSVKDFLDKIQANSQRLHCLVEDLLTLGELESGARQATGRELPLKTIVDFIESNYKFLLINAKINLNVSVPEDVQEKRFNDILLTQILENLIENSLKHAKGATVVKVAFTKKEHAIQGSVQDNGEGIPKEMLNKVFERFYCVDSSRSRSTGGTGLGLSIVKHLVESMGGEIYSTSDGKTFTRMTFTIPVTTT